MPSSSPPDSPPPESASSPSATGALRRYFITGILVTAPVGLTFYVAWLFVSFVDERVTPFIPRVYNPSTYLPFDLPGVGLLALIVFLVMTGWIAAGVSGRYLVRLGERILGRMPVIRSLYSAIKQICETVFTSRSQAFRQVVLFEYPRRGCWAMVFITGETEGEVQNVTRDRVVNVFLPTTPNPTSGYLLFLPVRELVPLSMSVEEGIKMVVSGGIITPPDRRSSDDQATPRVDLAQGDRPTIPPTPTQTASDPSRQG